MNNNYKRQKVIILNKAIKEMIAIIIIGLVSIIALLICGYEDIKNLLIGSTVVFTVVAGVFEYFSYSNKQQHEQDIEDIANTIKKQIEDELSQVHTRIYDVENRQQDMVDALKTKIFTTGYEASDNQLLCKNDIIMIPETASEEDAKVYLEEEARPLLENNIRLIEERYDAYQSEELNKLKKQLEKAVQDIRLSNLNLANKDKEINQLRSQYYQAECNVKTLIDSQKKAEQNKVKEQGNIAIKKVLEELARIKQENNRLVSKNSMLQIEKKEAENKAFKAETDAYDFMKENDDLRIQNEQNKEKLDKYEKQESYQAGKLKDRIANQLKMWKSTASSLGTRRIEIEKSYIDDLADINNEKIITKYINIMTQLYKTKDPRALSCNRGSITYSKQYQGYEHAKVNDHYRIWYKFDSKTDTITFSKAIHHNKQNNLL